jgi:ABC-type Na+ efflux pump permease subunit
MEPVINEVVLLGRFRHAGLPVQGVQKLVAHVPVTFRGLAKRNPKTGQIEDAPVQSRAIAVGVPAVLVMLMFMMVMVGATPLMQGVVEEKAMRIAEVLLASLKPFELMLGKLVGMVGVSLTLSLVYLGGAYWLAQRYGFAEYLPGDLLAYFICFQVLAVLMYGSLFVAIGAACTDVRETQTMLLPVLLVMVFPLFFMGYVIQNPDSALATGLSLFPLATPMLMTLRHGIPPGVPWWQSAMGMGIVILATLLCVWVAGRVFRVGILSQGKGASFRDMMRWVIHG